MKTYKKMKLSKIEKFIPMMEKQKVSPVARSKRGFLTKLQSVKGDYNKLGIKNKKTGATWMDTRHNFIKRHYNQALKNKEKFFIDEKPSRRTLALYAWGFDPWPKETNKYIRKLKL